MDATRIEPLSAETLNGARIQANSFLGARKAACGVLPYSCCPMGNSEFGAIYRKDPDKYTTSAVAIRSSDGRVVGFVEMSLHGQNRDWFASRLHTVRPGEAYIEQMSVSAQMRGQGIGTRLLQWSEDTAKSRGASVLSLGVVKGNPAERLYHRFGFQSIGHTSFGANLGMCCLLGCPHGQFGGHMMEKPIIPESIEHD